MRRLNSLPLRFATAASLIILTAYAKRANADVVLWRHEYTVASALNDTLAGYERDGGDL